MSEDSYHHMWKAMKDMRNVYDFQDWVHAVRNDGNVVMLEVKFPMGPLIENITQVMFKKGFTMLYWKEGFYEGYQCRVSSEEGFEDASN